MTRVEEQTYCQNVDAVKEYQESWSTKDQHHE